MPAGTTNGSGLPPINPVISNFDPAPGIAITRLQHISFDVTDDAGQFAAVFVVAVFANGTAECVFDSQKFQPRYLAGSSQVAINCGFRFVIRRVGGWVLTPLRIDVIAIDADANVTRAQVAFT